MPKETSKRTANGLSYHGGGWRFSTRVNGKPKWIPVPRTIQGIQEATTWKNSYLGQDENERLLPNKATFLEVAELALAALEKKGRAVGTMEQHWRQLRTWLAPLHNMQIQKIDKHVLVAKVVDPMKEAKRTGSTIHNAIMTASAIFEYAMDCKPKLVSENPVRRVKAGKGEDRPGRKSKKKRVILNKTQMQILLDYAGKPLKQRSRTERTIELRILYALLGFLGLRISEGLNLRWEWIDFENKKVWPNGTKTEASTEGSVELPKILAVMLAKHRLACGHGLDGDLVVASGTGTRFDKSNVRHALNELVERIQEDHPDFPSFTPHHLRHTYVSAVMRSTGDLALASKNARHANVQTTGAIYAHEWNETKEERRAADGIDAIFGEDRGVAQPG